jgi:protein O-mannosyl-transferase
LRSSEYSNWHPLTWLSHALDYTLYGLNPHGHHLTNVLFHMLNVVLFLLLARATGATGRSLLIAALFAVHPFNVESVAWIAERKNVLSTFFFLLTLGAYGWYALKPGLKRYFVVVALFVLGLDGLGRGRLSRP